MKLGRVNKGRRMSGTCVAVQADLGSLLLVPHVEGSHVHHLRCVHTHAEVILTGETLRADQRLQAVTSCVSIPPEQRSLKTEFRNTYLQKNLSNINTQFLHSHEVVFQTR